MEIKLFITFLALWLNRSHGQLTPVADCAGRIDQSESVMIPWNYTASGTLIIMEWSNAGIDGAGSDTILMYNGLYSYGNGYNASKVEHIDNGQAWLEVKNFQKSDAHVYKVSIAYSGDLFNDDVNISYTDGSEINDVRVLCDSVKLEDGGKIPGACTAFDVIIPNSWTHNFTVVYNNGDDSDSKENCIDNKCEFGSIEKGERVITMTVYVALDLCTGHLERKFEFQFAGSSAVNASYQLLLGLCFVIHLLKREE